MHVKIIWELCLSMWMDFKSGVNLLWWLTEFMKEVALIVSRKILDVCNLLTLIVFTFTHYSNLSIKYNDFNEMDVYVLLHTIIYCTFYVHFTDIYKRL